MNSSDEEVDEASTLSEQLNQSNLSPNATIQEVAMQNHFLQDFSQRILGKYNREKVRSAALEQDLNSTQVDLERQKVLLKLSEQKLLALSPHVSPPPSELQSALESLKAELSSNSTAKGTIRPSVLEKLTKAEDAAEKLRLECEYYREQFEQMMADAMTQVKCRNCKKTFIPKTNCSSACVYHPGKLHYYSCFGCGEDAYYTCCNRCGNCSTGCRTGSHVGL